MKFLYLLIDFFTIIIPLIFSYHPKIKFYKTGKAFFAASFVVTILFIIWDVLFTHLNVWSFNSRYITGIFFFNLPVEEVLFFISIPFSCVFTFFCLDKFYKLSWRPGPENIFCIFLSLSLLIIGLIFWDKWYTAASFISTAFLCLYLKFIYKISWFGKMISIYAVLLIPFFIVNGILTGTGIAEPVVMYNNVENLHIRVLTIPVEDFVYGFELVLLNVFFYKLFSKRFYAIEKY